MRYTLAMRRYALVFWACFVVSAQTSRNLFQAHCAGCHGPSGEGSRGPALNVSTLQHANDLDSLVILLRRGIPGTEMPALASEVVGDDALRGLAAYVLGLRVNTKAAASGPAGRGAELVRTKGKCLGCHRVSGEGDGLGPDLTDIGRQRDSQWLRRALTEPEADIYDSFGGYRWAILMPDNYLLVDLTTRSGDHVSGSRLNEDAFSIQIRDQQGRIRSFLKEELTELNKRWGKSPMPSYKNVFSADELDDVVAYLASLRGLR
jgi:putative heme-binding domain-containing protein